MGFEPTRAEHIGLAVQRLNHSATSSVFIKLLGIRDAIFELLQFGVLALVLGNQWTMISWFPLGESYSCLCIAIRAKVEPKAMGVFDTPKQPVFIV